MHRFAASPPVPQKFATAVAAASRNVRDAIRGNKAPKFDDGVWKKFTADLGKAQHYKCGFCEISAAVGFDPDVEHYYPKSEVASLAVRGMEIPPARVKGRKKKILSKRGYWWKAYSWDNYLLACGICNRKWKLSIFPVDGPPRTKSPTQRDVEVPLLLNPFTGEHPADHLEFDEFGAIAAYKGSRYGDETIKTCGLDRQRLCEARLKDAGDVHEIINELEADPPPTPARQKEILKRIERLGDERFAHCGMVRAIAQQRLGMKWPELQARLAANP